MGKRLSTLILVIGLLIWSTGESFGQLDCSRPEPNSLIRPWQQEAGGIPWTRGYPFNVWNAHVFQLDPNYKPMSDFSRQFTTTGSEANRVYKGYLSRDNNHFLPTTGLNFDTKFGDYTTEGDDVGFFKTGNTPTGLGGCDTELQHFGLIMQGRYVVPSPGIYRIRIGSDDGSFFRMFKNGDKSNLYLDLNGNPLRHDNWFKDPASPNFDGVFNFVYESNIKNYYVEFEGGEEVFIELNYYEKRLHSRLSFEFDLYFGPGEIKIPGNSTGIASYCRINPNPPAFESPGPAVFESGVVSTYQWQYSLSNGPGATWIDIPGAISATYDIPAYVEGNPDSWTGTRYFRRGATNTIVNDDETTTEVDVYSNVLQINMQAIENLDQHEFGENQWIGHIYNGVRNFSSSNYLGRDTENIIFNQNFGGYIGPGSPIYYSPDHGCAVIFDNKTVRYKMRMDVEPGTYVFKVNGDDGYRLFINGELTSINEWAKASGPKPAPDTHIFDVAEAGQIELVLEYYELGGNQRITFDFDFASTALPVEWGQVAGNPCGESNCLSWETLQEKNTSHFTVERSYNGQDWTSVGKRVEAQGFSTQSNSYEISDATFTRERSFYRIKQVDLDGSIDNSKTIRIDNKSYRNKMIPYPNPTVDRVRFYSAQEVLMIQVTSQDVRVNMRMDFEQVDQNIYELDFSQLQNSHYVITVVTKESRETHKIIKR